VRPLATLLLTLSVCACRPAHPAQPLFGLPNEKTGLTSSDCQPSCDCCDAGAAWVAPDDAALVTEWVLTTPYAALEADPYAAAAPAADPEGTVCAVHSTQDAGTAPRGYELATYASEDEARLAGVTVTHFGRCGVCSTLENLAVYLRHNDLGAPVRACGLKTGSNGQSDFDADLVCLRGLGFDLPCAQIWAWNTAHTRAQCLGVCLTQFDAPYNQPDGRLNDCLQCDEDQSGPVFKAVAGRTRRNSGIPNAICRPCAEVHPLPHRY
jgi:hypothetical protein